VIVLFWRYNSSNAVKWVKLEGIVPIRLLFNDKYTTLVKLNKSAGILDIAQLFAYIWVSVLILFITPGILANDGL